MLKATYAKQFERDLRLMKKRGKDCLVGETAGRFDVTVREADISGVPRNAARQPACRATSARSVTGLGWRQFSCMRSDDTATLKRPGRCHIPWIIPIRLCCVPFFVHVRPPNLDKSFPMPCSHKAIVVNGQVWTTGREDFAGYDLAITQTTRLNYSTNVFVIYGTYFHCPLHDFLDVRLEVIRFGCVAG